MSVLIFVEELIL